MTIFLRKNSWLFFAGGSLIIFSGIANIAIINFISISIQSEGQYFLEFPIHFLALIVASYIFGVLAQWILEGVGYSLVYQLREYILKQVVQAEPEQLKLIGKSKIYNTFSKDITQITDGVMFLPYALYGISLIIGGIIYMIYLSWILALLIVSVLGITIIFSYKFVGYCQGFLRRDRELHNQLVSAYENILDGHNELVLNENRGKVVVDSIMQGDALESKNVLTKAGRLIAINSQIIAVIFFGLVGLIFWAVHSWKWGMPELAVSFTIVLMFLRQPVGNLVHQVPVILQTKISLQHFLDLHLPSPQDIEPATQLVNRWDQLVLKNVCYKYPENDLFLLGPVDLTIKHGELLFLVGANGAGKSTLVKLLTGLLFPTVGDIFIDDLRVDKNNRRQYRAMFSAVLTDFYLFDRVLLKENNFNIDRDIEKLIKRLELENVISVNNGRFSSTKLSTGQRKRLAMVVACLDNRPIMVLDEWAADQDPIFRKRFYEEILPELKGRGITIVVVSHDDRYFHLADRVVELKSGAAILK